MSMYNPPHPGETIDEDCIQAVGWTIMSFSIASILENLIFESAPQKPP